MDTGKNEFARQTQLGGLLRHTPDVQLPGDQAHGVLRRPGRHLHHHVCTEDVRREEHPEDVVDEETGEEEGGDLEAGQTHEGDEGDAEAHAHGVHQQPMTCNDTQTVTFEQAWVNGWQRR